MPTKSLVDSRTKGPKPVDEPMKPACATTRLELNVYLDKHSTHTHTHIYTHIRAIVTTALFIPFDKPVLARLGGQA